MLGPMPYFVPWQLLPYAIVKIGVNSTADIKNGISIVIGNSIVRNNSMPNDIVKANTNVIMPESYTGLHKLI
jgi:hypothetical protein